MSQHLERVGQLVGEYRLLNWLGGGSFGEVYLGEHIRSHQQVALKVLHARLTHKEEWRAFLNEARMMRLQHPHIVPLLDFGITDEDVPFLVMEYAPNGTLRRYYPRGARLPLTIVTDYVQAMASALQYAHDQHLVHRDVKPENMLLGANHNLLLSDFGIVTVAHSSHSVNAVAGVEGTMPYMAPEQFNGEPRPASDQYSLGIVAYEWLCGVRPFTGTPVEIAMQHNLKPPPPMRLLVPELPPEMEQVIFTALAKDPRARFANVQAFANALSQAASQPVRSAGPISVAPTPRLTLPLLDRSAEGGAASGPLLHPPLTQPPPHTDAEQMALVLGEKNVPGVDPAAYTVAGGPVSPSAATFAKNSGQLPAQPPARPPLKWTREKVILLLGALLFIIGSISIISTTVSISTLHSQATATAQGATATTRAIPTATAQAQIAATAQMRTTINASINAYAQNAASSGVMYGFNAQHTNADPYEKILNAGNVPALTKSWAFLTGNFVPSSPAIVDSVAYVGSLDNQLHAINVATGVQKWAFTSGGIIYSSPAVFNGLVYVGSTDHNLYAIDAATGTARWAFPTKNVVVSSPAIVGGVVYIGSWDNTLYALDAATGAPKWSFPTQGFISASPAVANGTVYVASFDGNLYALDAATGTKKWSFAIGNGAYANSSPTVANGMVYVGGRDNVLYAFDAATGTPRWSFPTGSNIYATPAVANGILYIGSNDHYLYALDAATGVRKWAFQTGDIVASGPTVANGVVYFGSNDHFLYALDAATGVRLWSFQTGAAIYGSAPVVANGMLFVGSFDHYVYAFSLPTGTS